MEIKIDSIEIYKHKMESNLRKDFQCVICLGVLITPVSHTTCRKHFCTPCINQSMQNSNDCPNCRTSLLTSPLISDHSLAQEINSTQYHCQCGESISYSNYNDHMTECRFMENLIKQAAKNTEKPPVPVVNRWTYKCPRCDQKNLDRQGLLDHYKQRHRGQSGICPICSVMPWGDSNYVSQNLDSHMHLRHKYDTETYTDYSMEDEQILQKVMQDSLNLR